MTELFNDVSATEVVIGQLEEHLRKVLSTYWSDPLVKIVIHSANGLTDGFAELSIVSTAFTHKHSTERTQMVTQVLPELLGAQFSNLSWTTRPLTPREWAQEYSWTHPLAFFQ